MKCKSMERDMEEYLDGALSGKKRAAFDRHLENCTACRKNLLQRQRLGERLSGSLQRIAGQKEPSAELSRKILSGAEKEKSKPLRPLLPWPKFATAAILPLLVLSLFIVLMQKKKDKTQLPGFYEQGRASYIKLSITHFADPSSKEWSVKRVYVKRSNGEEGSLTIELAKKT